MKSNEKLIFSYKTEHTKENPFLQLTYSLVDSSITPDAFYLLAQQLRKLNTHRFYVDKFAKDFGWDKRRVKLAVDCLIEHGYVFKIVLSKKTVYYYFFECSKDNFFYSNVESKFSPLNNEQLKEVFSCINNAVAEINQYKNVPLKGNENNEYKNVPLKGNENNEYKNVPLKGNENNEYKNVPLKGNENNEYKNVGNENKIVHNENIIAPLNNILKVKDNISTTTILNNINIEQMNEKAKMMIDELNSKIGNEFAQSVGKQTYDELPELFTRKFHNLNERFQTTYIKYYSTTITAHHEYSLMDWVSDVDVVQFWKKSIMNEMKKKWATYNEPAPTTQPVVQPEQKQNYGENAAAGDELVSSTDLAILQTKMFGFLGWLPNLHLLEEFIKFVGIDSRKVSHWCKAFTKLKGERAVNEQLNAFEKEQLKRKSTLHAGWGDCVITEEERKARDEANRLYMKKKEEEEKNKQQKQIITDSVADILEEDMHFYKNLNKKHIAS